MQSILRVQGERAVAILTDLMFFICKYDDRDLAVTIGNTIVEYFGSKSTLISNRKQQLQQLRSKCYDYSWMPEVKAFAEEVARLMEQE